MAKELREVARTDRRAAVVAAAIFRIGSRELPDCSFASSPNAQFHVYGTLSLMSDLFALAKQDQVAELKALFNKGIGVKAADEQGRTLLHHAAASNAVGVIDLLVERGAPIEAKDAQGYTVRTLPLNAAVPCALQYLLAIPSRFDSIRSPIFSFIDSWRFRNLFECERPMLGWIPPCRGRRSSSSARSNGNPLHRLLPP